MDLVRLSLIHIWTWIEVVDDNFYKEYALSRNGYINYIVSRTLILRADKDKGSYAKGLTRTIPEHKLDKALAAYRKQEHTFKQRSYLGNWEWIVIHSSSAISLSHLKRVFNKTNKNHVEQQD